MQFLKYLLTTYITLLSIHSFGQNGYEIKLKFKQPLDNKKVQLAHYFAKPLPTVYIADSGEISNNSLTLKSRDSILGGIYLVLFDNGTKYFEFILDNGNKLQIDVDTTQLPTKIKFNNSILNEGFQQYQALMHTNRTNTYKLHEERKGKSINDSIIIAQKIEKEMQNFKKERQQLLNKFPNTFLSTIINSFMNPDVPSGIKFIADTDVVDSLFDYYYFKNHYWEKFNFNDNRLAYTPILDHKLDQYFKYVLPIPDSFIHEADYLLEKTKNTPELFKYFLFWLTNYTYSSKVMGMDEAFVHLVANYYMKGAATWLTTEQVKKYIDEAQKISPNLIGMKGPDIPLVDLFSLKPITLYDFKAKYTLLVIWRVDCGHCQTEIPLLDSVYKSSLEKYGAKIFSIAIHDDQQGIVKFVKENNISYWQHGIDIDGNSRIKENYDAYTTPKIYVLDENKVIVGKNLDHSNIEGLLKFLEKKKDK